MATSTVEDYLKTILIHEEPLASGQLVSMGQIGMALEVAPGTVTAMVKSLERDQLLSYEPYSGVRLTEAGRRMAVHVLRRHRLIELFLVETLGLDWSEVHDEAERLEHAMSDKLVDKIDALLGYPSVDPHGDPIPDANGELRQPEVLMSLKECRAGERLRIARVSDQDERFLRFVEQNGLKPGTQVTVLRHDEVADAITLKPPKGEAVTIGGEAAAKLWVEPTRKSTSE
jgi:DtxR family Mn-dependent transcriptional regulator